MELTSAFVVQVSDFQSFNPCKHFNFGSSIAIAFVIYIETIAFQPRTLGAPITRFPTSDGLTTFPSYFHYVSPDPGLEKPRKALLEIVT